MKIIDSLLTRLLVDKNPGLLWYKRRLDVVFWSSVGCYIALAYIVIEIINEPILSKLIFLGTLLISLAWIFAEWKPVVDRVRFGSLTPSSTATVYIRKLFFMILPFILIVILYIVYLFCLSERPLFN